MIPITYASASLRAGSFCKVREKDGATGTRLLFRLAFAFSDAALGAVFQLAWERALAYRQTSERLLGYLQASA